MKDQATWNSKSLIGFTGFFKKKLVEEKNDNQKWMRKGYRALNTAQPWQHILSWKIKDLFSFPDKTNGTWNISFVLLAEMKLLFLVTLTGGEQVDLNHILF